MYETDYGAYAAAQQDISPGWVGIPGMNWGLSSHITNWSRLKTPDTIIAPYMANAVLPYRCPADRFLAPEQRRAGWDARVLSATMNRYFGYSGPLGANRYYDIGGFRLYERASDFRKRSSSDVVLIVDEHPDANGAAGIAYGFSYKPAPAKPQWISVPANYHRGGSGIAFADGHAVVRRLLDYNQMPPVRYIYLSPEKSHGLARRDSDWFAYHIGERILDDEDRLGLPR